LHPMRHTEHGWVHGTDASEANASETETVGWEDGWERTYADAYTERWCDADADWRTVDGSLLMVLLYDDLVAVCGWGCARWRSVEGRWRRVAVDVGVVGDVREVGTTRHREYRARWKKWEWRMCERLKDSRTNVQV
jgi:hypothetical protein